MTIPEIIESVVDCVKSFDTDRPTRVDTGVYEFPLYNDDADYFHVNARVIAEFEGSDYFGVVTSITDNVLTCTFIDITVDIGIMSEGLTLDINYLHGHPLDVFDQIQRMANSATYKLRRFPVIALMEDFDTDVQEGINETPIQIILAVRTESHYTAKQRYVESYDGKRLTKIYERFIKCLRTDRSTYFRPQDHTATYRLYWGREGAFGNIESKPFDIVDAIELNIDLKTLNNC